MGPKQVMEWAEKKINGGVALTEEDSVDVHVVVRCTYVGSHVRGSQGREVN